VRASFTVESTGLDSPSAHDQVTTTLVGSSRALAAGNWLTSVMVGASCRC
jgi:hypothetical protein